MSYLSEDKKNSTVKKCRVFYPLVAMGLVLALAGTSGASARIGASVSLVSDYVFRGVSQTFEDPAAQAGLNYSHDNGLYAGFWGSNVDFGTEADLELDLYAGFAKELENDFSWEVGAIHYAYPGESEIDFDEVYAGVGYRFLSLKYSYSDDFAGSGGRSDYLEIGASFELPRNFGFGFSAGQSTFDDRVGIEDYMDFKAAVSKVIKSFVIELAVAGVDTDQFDNLGEDRFIFMVSREI